MQGRAGQGVVAAICVLAAAAAHARPPEPRVFSTPPAPAEGESPWAFDVWPEYRARIIRVDPLDVNGTEATRVSWAEHRLRLDLTFARKGVGAVFVQLDLMDGALFGDNGEFGSDPQPTNGLGIASKQQNLAGWQVGVREGGDPLEPEGYGPVLRPVEPVRINYAYGEVLLPVGVLRVGRMPLIDGDSVTASDGRTGRNRWGASYFHESSDRVLFGTKLSEVFRLLKLGDDYVPDTRMDDGLIFGGAYDWLVEDDILTSSDDLQQVAILASWRKAEGGWLPAGMRDFSLSFTFTYRWEERFNTSIVGLPMSLKMRWRDLSLSADAMVIRGTTRELSAGLSELTGDDVNDQRIEAQGFQATLDYELGPVTLTAQYGYASGDDDPRPGNALTSLSWPRDRNLGLLLFEHVVAFQSARSAAVGIENLRQLDAESFPLTEIATDGRVNDVQAFFPQVFYDPFDSLRLKAGVLFAWADKPVTDPIQSILAYDGDEISDDAVNYFGGKPGGYWGTEIDVGVEWRYRELFEAVIEAGVLLPGSALEDENGDAVTSWMLETRFTFSL